MSGPVRSLAGLAYGLATRWWPQLLALAAACAVVATTITGALGVGDVIQAGLHRLAVGRLGRIEAALLGDGFFRRSLADELAAAGGAELPRLTCTPALVLPVTLAATTPDAGTSRATLLACDDPAGLGFEPPPPPLEEATLLVNRGTIAWNTGDALYLQSGAVLSNQGLFLAGQSSTLLYNGGTATAFDNTASGTVRAHSAYGPVALTSAAQNFCAAAVCAAVVHGPAPSSSALAASMHRAPTLAANSGTTAAPPAFQCASSPTSAAW